MLDHVPIMASSMHRAMASSMAAFMGPCMDEPMADHVSTMPSAVDGSMASA